MCSVGRRAERIEIQNNTYFTIICLLLYDFHPKTFSKRGENRVTETSWVFWEIVFFALCMNCFFSVKFGKYKSCHIYYKFNDMLENIVEILGCKISDFRQILGHFYMRKYTWLMKRLIFLYLIFNSLTSSSFCVTLIP